MIGFRLYSLVMDGQWTVEPEELPDGSLRAPDDVVYRRTPRRVTRRIGNEVLAAGAIVVTDVYPEGLTFHVGDAADAAWEDVAPRLVSGRRTDAHDIQWVGHLWESDDGRQLMRFDGEH
ncbi:hypothetical protein FB00_13390 [Cellulosimicrobium funkei]|uniref:Uncharacterized protein n=2 Tax=Cellulosimicrobium TaxID=157920 RepID=A0A0H2KM75_9MICO|nr:hypothetical protein FB00_13390 [Cellulosimicrobium funkei]